MDKRTIDRIREDVFSGATISDVEIESIASGSFTEARINLELAVSDMAREVKLEISRLFGRMM